jgi:hypothetical protein
MTARCGGQRSAPPASRLSAPQPERREGSWTIARRPTKDRMDQHLTIDLQRLDGAGVAGVVVEWAARKGWDPGLRDAEAFSAADPEGFLGAYTDGELEGPVSTVRYGGGFGSIGLLSCARTTAKACSAVVWRTPPLMCSATARSA